MRAESQPATVAGRYALHALLERSTVGTVWLARDTVLDRAVTLTLVDPVLTRDADARERLFASARALAAAAPTTLVRLFDAGVDGDAVYLVTERVSGDGLADMLEREGSVEPERAASIVAGVLDGIGEAHALGLTRIDVRPPNIHLDERGRVRIRVTGLVCGAVNGGAAPDDVGAAGELLFELVAGRPVDGDRHLRRLRAPRTIRTALIRSLGDPQDRFHDVTAMAIALREAGRRGAKSPPDDAEDGTGGRRGSVFRTWIAVPLVISLVAAAFVAAGVRLGDLRIGGGSLIRLREQPPTQPPPSARPLDVSRVSVLDPFGDGVENDDDAADAADGDPATVWRSEDYWDGTLNKNGIGLALDLGRERTVSGFRLSTPSGGFRFSVLVGDDPSTMVEQAPSAPSFVAPHATRGLDPQTGRYVVVWITSVVLLADGSHRAEVSDVRVFGHD